MTQMKEGTFTATAITEALKLFPTSSDITKVLFIITDGDPAPGQEPGPALATAPSDIMVYGIGVGAGVKKENIKAMSTQGLYFTISDYHEFKQFAEMLKEN